MVSTSSLSFANDMDLFRRRYAVHDRTTRIRKMADDMSVRARIGICAIEEHETEKPLAQRMVFSHCHVSNSPSNTDTLEKPFSNATRALLRDDDNFWTSSHVCGSLASDVGVSGRLARRFDDGSKHNDYCSSEACAGKVIDSDVYGDDTTLSDGVYGNNLGHLRQQDHESLLMRATLKGRAEMREVAETELSVQAEEEPTSFSYSRELEKIQARTSRSGINTQEENSKSQCFPFGICRVLDGETAAENTFLPELVDSASGSSSCSMRRRSLPANVPFVAMSFDEKMDSIRQRFDTFDRSRRIHSMFAVDSRTKPAKQEQETTEAQCPPPYISTRCVEDSLADQQDVVRDTHKAVAEEFTSSSRKLGSQCDFWSASYVCGNLSADIPTCRRILGEQNVQGDSVISEAKRKLRETPASFFSHAQF